MTKVSIIVPVYNTQENLRKCLDSLINQEYTDYEIIVINDGSTDNSEEIILEYKELCKEKIKYYKKKNTGVADTRNYGISKATGKYIMFVDSDDYISKDLLKSLSKYIENDVELIKYKIKKVDGQGNELEKISGPVFEEEITGQEAFNHMYSEDVVLDSPCVYLMKKSIFTKNNLQFKVNTYHEDFGLIPHVVVLAKTMVSTPNYDYFYVQSSNSITRNNDYSKTIKKAYDTLTHYDYLEEQIPNYNLSRLTMENIKIYYTNAILLKTLELSKDDQNEFIKEIKKRKLVSNIKCRNIKQLIKRVILSINIKWYLKLQKK